MKKKRGGRWTTIFLCCTLAVPTVATIMGEYGGTPTMEQATPAMVVGALLGLAHLFLRPVSLLRQQNQKLLLLQSLKR